MPRTISEQLQAKGWEHYAEGHACCAGQLWALAVRAASQAWVVSPERMEETEESRA